jgi:uncharacterized protein (TIGR04255 family)
VANLVTPYKLPVYEKPPVTEVVCSVLFESIETLLTPHIGLLWEKFQPDYPLCEDAPPLAPAIELFNPSIEAKFQFTNVPPLPRVWFIRSDQTGIIQIQRDRFIHNWRKVRTEDEYLRYEKIIELFQDYLSSFNSFLNETNLGQIEPRQYELAYINQIPQGQGWDTIEDIGNIFPDFAWRAGMQRFLNDPKAISWSTSFNLPNEIGRLHAAVNQGMDINNKPVLSFELIVRGIGKDKTNKSIKDWFDMAHEWIVYSFADLTGEKVQTDIWGRLG